MGDSGRFMPWLPRERLRFSRRRLRNRRYRRARGLDAACPEARDDRRGDALGVESAVLELRGRIAVVDESIRQSEMQYRDDDIALGERLGDRAARSARDDVFLDGHEVVVRLREVD